MKLVLLDRDGVINEDLPTSVKTKDEFILLPGVINAIKLLNQAKVPIAIITNQAVVGRGLLTEKGLNDIHDHFKTFLKEQGAYVDKIYVCPSNDPNHPDRKPNPGLLLKALKDFQVSPKEAVFIGDALRDLKAAQHIDCPRILVRTGKGEKTIKEGLPEDVMPVPIFDTLFSAITHLLRGPSC